MTLIEVMVAATVLIVGILSTFSMVDAAQRTTQSNTARTAATNLAREILEQARSLNYAELTPAAMVARLRTRPGLLGEIDAQGRWVVVRRNTRLTVTASVCTFDDPMDGLSAMAPANACPAATPVAGAPSEANPDDFRRLDLTLERASGATTTTSRHSALVANPSGGQGPGITGFVPDPFTIQVTTGVTVPFVVTTTSATTVRWSMDDGIHAGDASGGPSVWGFNWDIGTVGVGTWTVDGTYTANAQPFNSHGVPGEMRVASVLLNRRVPLAVANLAGGRSEYSGGVVELEWTSNPERDIIGYRVYRTGSDNIKKRVCPSPTAGTNAVSAATSCTDPTPGLTPLYHVVAVDRPTLGDPSSGLREGDAAALVVTGLGLRPLPPTALIASTADGRTRLDWTAPIGLPVLFYRIYKDGVRYDRTATNAPNYVDPAVQDGAPHTYAVAAVSDTYNESELSAQVIAG